MSQTTHQQSTPTGVDPKKKFRIILLRAIGRRQHFSLSAAMAGAAAKIGRAHV